MAKEVKVTSAQVHAAKLIVERAKRHGEEVSAAILKIANAEPKNE